MITLALTALLIVVALATALALADGWIRGRYILERLQQERALIDAGFVPMAAPQELRIRPKVRFETLAMQSQAADRFAAQHRTAPRPAARRAAHGVA